jgi:hypothetical protein
MRIFVAFLIVLVVLAAVYFWDAEYNRGKLFDGLQMTKKMTAEEFFDAWDMEHPLRDGCKLGECLDAMIAAQKAYREYDPVGAADLDKRFPPGPSH